ncbi:MAG: carboxypeptidase regulatory-like domain-containing protein [Deltaproteobacteria bacterium]|nr:carboxypeptidase regulatory-like domain-containing protein [Deltaproteobacteria bacterium]
MSFKKAFKLAAFLALVSILIVGCSGKNGNNGANGPSGANGAPGISTGTLSGTVVNSATQNPIANATIALNPAVAANVSTDTNGKFTFANIPIGPYEVIVSASGYNQLTSDSIAVVAGMTLTTILSLTPGPKQSPLITWPSNYYVNSLDVGLYNVGYGSTVNITANVSDPNYSSSALTYTWTVTPYPQYGGVETLLAGANTASINFTTDNFSNLSNINYMYSFLNGITPEQARDSIIAIGPMQVGLYRIELYVTNPAGVQATSAIMVRSASKTAGVDDVPIGLPVYLNFTETTPNVTFAKPLGSSAVTSTIVATSPTTVVMFKPDVAGIYWITETTSGSSFSIAAGSWAGAYSNKVTGTYESLGYGGDGSPGTCTYCHNDVIAPNRFPPNHNITPHAVMFINGISGLLGDGTIGPSGYEPIDEAPYDNAPIDLTTNEVCLSCHTVGYDQAEPITASGFNVAMKSTGWTFPSVLQASNWTSMLGQYPTVAAFGNIQCESCHGPTNSDFHMTTRGGFANEVDAGPRIMWNAGVCAQCHDSEGPDWEVSPHATLSLAISEATIQHSPSAANCGRCHSAQGFNEYQGEISSGVNNGMQPLGGSIPFNTTQLAALGLTTPEVQPQSCQSCHDPHDVDYPGLSSQLRVYNTASLAAGFTVQSVGAGATCMLCHNTRNGLHNDSTGIADYEAPHTPSQADILMGQNSYFTGITGTTTIYVSKHANLSDTCVTCHMTFNPNNPGGAPSSHVWTINPQDKGALCQNCHGVGTTGDGLQTEVTGLLNKLDTKLSNDVQTAINFSAGTNSIYLGTTSPVATPVTVSTFISTRGQEGYVITDSSNITYTVAVSSITTGTFTGYVFPLNNAANPTATTIVEAGWNYSLVNSDGSLGIHNPTYILTILDNSIQQLP